MREIEKIEKSTKALKEQFHKEYIKTAEFAYVRDKVFERDGHKCVICGRTTNLVCHHTNYKYLGQHNQHEIDNCVTLCQLDHLNHHRGKYNLNWYSIDHPRNNDDLREITFDNAKILVRSNGKDFYDAETFKRYKIYENKNRNGRHTIGINHKMIFCYRVVAMAFPEICGKWFDGCEVHHINENPCDDRAENLKVLSPEAHQEIHKYFLADWARENLSIPVYQYTLSGNYISRWENSITAADSIGIANSAIRNCLCGISSTCGGYIWKTFEPGEDVPLFVPPIKTAAERSAEKLSIPIDQYSLDGKFIKTFAGQKEALRELGKDSGAITNCLKGRSKTAFGYVWKYHTT